MRIIGLAGEAAAAADLLVAEWEFERYSLESAIRPGLEGLFSRIEIPDFNPAPDISLRDVVRGLWLRRAQAFWNVLVEIDAITRDTGPAGLIVTGVCEDDDADFVHANGGEVWLLAHDAPGDKTAINPTKVDRIIIDDDDNPDDLRASIQYCLDRAMEDNDGSSDLPESEMPSSRPGR